MIENGFYSNIPEAQYHESDGFSKSDMTRILHYSPAHWKTPDLQETEAMEFGSAMHPGILEPDRFKKQFAIYPQNCLPGSGQGQRSRKADFEEEAEENGLTIIKPEWMDQIIAMRDAVLCHPTVKELKLLEDGESELSAYYYDTDFEVFTKCRYDYLNKINHKMSDVKSTTDAREHKFSKIAWDKSYGLQSAHYCYTATKLTNILHDEFYFIVAERPKIKGQYVGVMVYKATDELINDGLVDRSRALTIYNECQKSNQWPGYSKEIIHLKSPPWKQRINQNAIFD